MGAGGPLTGLASPLRFNVCAALLFSRTGIVALRGGTVRSSLMPLGLSIMCIGCIRRMHRARSACQNRK